MDERQTGPFDEFVEEEESPIDLVHSHRNQQFRHHGELESLPIVTVLRTFKSPADKVMMSLSSLSTSFNHFTYF
jgi:hypothetical protein